MFLPPKIGKKFSKKFRVLGKEINKMFPNIKFDLIPAGIEIEPSEYYALSIANALFISLFFGILISTLMIVKGRPNAIFLSFAITLGLFLLFSLLYIEYPGITARKKSDILDQDLVFGLKDIILQISSGVSLYEAMKAVSNAGYEEISHQFKRLIQSVDSGNSMMKALEDLALSTKSEYLKRTCWQIINSLKTGSNLKDILRGIVKELSEEQKTKIRNYARELNLWSLLYMLFAVAVPSIGSTMLVILSSFAGYGVNQNTFIMFVVLSLIVQVILIGFVKSRRPIVGI